MDKEFRVLGAGPAGLAAAITLARAGRNVVVYEQAQDCGRRFGGDLQGLENWSSDTDILDELKAIGIDVEFDCTPFTSVYSVSSTLQVTRHIAAAPLFYLVHRGAAPGSFDQALKRQALRAGVRIEFGATCNPELVDIVATGPVRRPSIGVVRGVVFPTDAPDCAYMMFDNELSYLGYSYLLITRGRGCLCVVAFDRFEQSRRRLDFAIERLSRLSGVAIDRTTPVNGFGTFQHNPKYQQDGRLHCGEAAGLQDLLWGFGLRFALQSGNLAAHCLLENRDYGQVAQRAFESRLRVGVVNRFVWEILGNFGYRWFLRRARRHGELRAFCSSMFRYSLWHRLAFPIALRGLRLRHPELAY